MTFSTFRKLAANDPEELIGLIRKGFPSDGILASAVEALGSNPGYGTALIPFLDHPATIVQEGAVHGLRQHLRQPNIVEVLNQKLTNPDTHANVVVALRGVLG